MKSDRGRREALSEPGDQEMLGWILRRRKLRRGHEAKAMITMITEEHTPPGALLAQCLKARPYDLAANAAPLKVRLDRHGAESEPPALRRNTDF